MLPEKTDFDAKLHFLCSKTMRLNLFYFYSEAHEHFYCPGKRHRFPVLLILRLPFFL